MQNLSLGMAWTAIHEDNLKWFMKTDKLVCEIYIDEFSSASVKIIPINSFFARIIKSSSMCKIISSHRQLMNFHLIDSTRILYQ